MLAAVFDGGPVPKGASCIFQSTPFFPHHHLIPGKTSTLLPPHSPHHSTALQAIAVSFLWPLCRFEIPPPQVVDFPHLIEVQPCPYCVSYLCCQPTSTARTPHLRLRIFCDSHSHLHSNLVSIGNYTLKPDTDFNLQVFSLTFALFPPE